MSLAACLRKRESLTSALYTRCACMKFQLSQTVHNTAAHRPSKRCASGLWHRHERVFPGSNRHPPVFQRLGISEFAFSPEFISCILELVVCAACHKNLLNGYVQGLCQFPVGVAMCLCHSNHLGFECCTAAEIRSRPSNFKEQPWPPAHTGKDSLRLQYPPFSY